MAGGQQNERGKSEIAGEKQIETDKQTLKRKRESHLNTSNK